MKALRILVISGLLLTQSACSFLEVQGTIPSMERIDAWVADDEFGQALSSLEHIPAETPNFSAYVSKRKEVALLADNYERRILAELDNNTNKQDSASRLSLLDKALGKYPDSEALRKKHKALLTQHLRRVRKLDAEALLVRAQLLYNKLPLHEQDARESPINISAQFKLQSMRSEIADMHNRLTAMAQLLLDDKDYALANRCLAQARQFPAGQDSLEQLEVLQKQINTRQKSIAAKKSKKLGKKKKDRSNRLQQDIDTAINNNQLVKASKLLDELGKLDHNNANYLRLKLQHQEKVTAIVKKKINDGNTLYRQENILQAKKVWEEALRLDPGNKTLQTSILRAKHVLKKLERLRQQQSATDN
ncbi:hypothetical protein [Sulfuriflexus mobilis]|uniref:hypothetical protein n=1 Tax=Sulfuriflexus mobilis TaxID=1811807 RepID=UPI000F8378F3|nr:hypothetical protein [Sulfuriflexus mobilis]